MLLATNSSGERVRPSKNIDASCPVCDHPVIAKMGNIVIHHWAHKPGSDCTYGTGMTEWHYKWILKHYQREGWEVEYSFASFRFDCFHPERRIAIEFQKRPLYD